MGRIAFFDCVGVLRPPAALIVGWKYTVAKPNDGHVPYGGRGRHVLRFEDMGQLVGLRHYGPTLHERGDSRGEGGRSGNLAGELATVGVAPIVDGEADGLSANAEGRVGGAWRSAESRTVRDMQIGMSGGKRIGSPNAHGPSLYGEGIPLAEVDIEVEIRIVPQKDGIGTNGEVWLDSLVEAPAEKPERSRAAASG